MPINLEGLRALMRQEEEKARQEQAQKQQPAVQPAVRSVPQPGSGEQILLLPVEALEDHPSYARGIPYRPASEARLAQLAESIRRNGILSPLLVRPLPEGRWQILAGHNRSRAAARAGLPALPCIVKDVPEDEAMDILISDNLSQRLDGLLPSEKAHAYKMKLDVMRRQGQRTDLTCTPVGYKLVTERSVRILAADSPDSATQIQRYIRLTELTPGLLELVDSRRLGLRVAVALSYLCLASQRCVQDFLDSGHKLTQAVADQLREIDADPAQEITPALLLELTQPARQRAPRVIKLQMKSIRRYFTPDATPEDIEQTIARALDAYFNQRGKLQ